MEKQKRNDVAALLRYAGGHKGLTFLGLALSGLAMLLSMVPYICIWLAARDLIAVAPDWTQAESVAQYGWLAFAFAGFSACACSACFAPAVSCSLMEGRSWPPRAAANLACKWSSSVV